MIFVRIETIPTQIMVTSYIVSIIVLWLCSVAYRTLEIKLKQN